MAAAGAGGGGGGAGKQYFKEENVYIIIGHGFDPGDRRFFVRPGHHITLPRRCGSKIIIDLDGIKDFFDDSYKRVKVPTIRDDPRNLENSISTLGLNLYSMKAVERKLYRSEFINRNPEYSINEAFGRFTAPDILITLFYIDAIGSGNNFTIGPDNVKYDNLTAYLIRLTGIYKHTKEPSLADIKQTIDKPKIIINPKLAKFSGRTVLNISENVNDEYTVKVYGKPDYFTRPIETLDLENPIEMNFFSVIQDILSNSYLQYLHLVILWFFAKKKNRGLSADELISVHQEVIAGIRAGQELNEIPIRSVSYIDTIYLNISDLTIDDIINLQVRLSFLMDYIAKISSQTEPIMVNVHACRTTDLSNKERREHIEASENEGYSAAATRRRKPKKKFKPGGKSRHTRKAKAKAATSEENNE